jgi:hypothetical protein
MAFPQNPNIQNGNMLFDLYGNFQSSKYKDIDNSKTTRFRFNTDIGYFFMDKFAGGIRLDYSSTKPETQNDAYTSFQVAPYVRYYAFPKTNKVNLYGDVSYGFGSEGEADKESFNYFGVMAGPSVFLNQHTALEGTLNYRTYGGDAFGDYRYNSFGFQTRFQTHMDAHEKIKDNIFARPNIVKGDFMGGGGLQIDFSKYKDIPNSKTTYFSFDPEFGYFFIDRLAGGVKLEYSSEKDETDDDAFTEFTVRPYIQYYFLPTKNKVNLFANASYGFGSVGQANKESFGFYQIKAGPVFFLNEHTALETGLYYKSYSGDAYNDEHLNNFGIRVTLQLHFNGNGNVNGNNQDN